MNNIDNMNNIEIFFDEMASSWDQRESHTTKEKIDLLDEVKINKNDKIIDIACGTGVLTSLLHLYSNEKIIGVDISSKMIEIAKEKYKNDNYCSFYHLDLMDLDESNKFDVAIIYNAYPHFLDPDALSLKLSKILNKDGKFAILHSLSRFELVKHHAQRANNVSRTLDSPINESRYFTPYFDIICAKENEHTFVLIGKLK